MSNDCRMSCSCGCFAYCSGCSGNSGSAEATDAYQSLNYHDNENYDKNKYENPSGIVVPQEDITCIRCGGDMEIKTQDNLIILECPYCKNKKIIKL